MLAPRARLLLGQRRFEGVDQHGTRAPRLDHLVDVPPLGSGVWIREPLAIVLDQLRALRLRVVGFARSLGLPAVAPNDELERELRVDELADSARRILGDRTVPFVFGYRVRLGVV